MSLLDEPEDRALPFELVVTRAPPGGGRAPGRASPVVIVSGGVRRSAVSPAVPTSRPCSRASATTRRRAGRARARAAARAPRTSGNALSNRASIARTWASRSSSIASTTAQAAAHATGLPPKVEAWSPGTNAPAASVGDEQRADRQPVREPLRERDRVGADAGRCQAKNVAGAADAGLHLVEDEQRAELVGERARLLERSRPSSGCTPPSPCTGSRKIAAVSGRAAATSDSTSFGVAKRTPGTSGSNGAASPAGR